MAGVTRRQFLCACAGAAAARGEPGQVDIELEASAFSAPLGSTGAPFWGYNNQLPGPLIEARAGDTLRLRFRNALREHTNLHFHGLHVSPEGNADNVFVMVEPGGGFTYEVAIPPDHPSGTFWYHPHVHGRTAGQVFRGMAGPLLIRGALDEIPEVAAAKEHLLVLQDFDPGGGEPSPTERMTGREGDVVAVSGRIRPRLAIERDGLARLRAINASASRYYRLRLDDHPLAWIATDGGALPGTRLLDEILLAPGQRADLLVRGDRPPGAYRLWNLPYDRGGMGMMRPARPAEVLAELVYDGAAERPVPLPERLLPFQPIEGGPAVTRVFQLSEGMMMQFLINGRAFDAARTDTRVRLGDVEEWEIRNTGQMDHPFHLHVNPFQVLGPAGAAEDAWRDVVNVPRGGRVRLRVRFADFPGRTVYHCHILDHEDLGMMGVVGMGGD